LHKEDADNKITVKGQNRQTDRVKTHTETWHKAHTYAPNEPIVLKDGDFVSLPF